MWAIKMGFFPLYLLAALFALLSKLFGLISRSLERLLRWLFD